MNLQMKIHKEIEHQLDQTDLYKTAEAFGRLAVEVFGRDRGKSQLRALENIANSTLKVSDVLDYIKRQTARMKQWQDKNFGKQMLDYIEKELGAKKEKIFDELLRQEPEALHGHPGEFKKQEIAMQLIRGFVKQLVIHFEWTLAQPKGV